MFELGAVAGFVACAACRTIGCTGAFLLEKRGYILPPHLGAVTGFVACAA